MNVPAPRKCTAHWRIALRWASRWRRVVAVADRLDVSPDGGLFRRRGSAGWMRSTHRGPTWRWVARVRLHSALRTCLSGIAMTVPVPDEVQRALEDRARAVGLTVEAYAADVLTRAVQPDPLEAFIGIGASGRTDTLEMPESASRARCSNAGSGSLVVVTVLVDGGVFIAAADRDQTGHAICARLLREHRDQLVVPSPVVPEAA